MDAWDYRMAVTVGELWTLAAFFFVLGCVAGGVIVEMLRGRR